MDIRDSLKSIPPEEIERRNKEQIEDNDKIFKDFKDAYQKGCCSLCGMKLDYFDPSETCFHWFTMPKNIKKKDFKEYLKEPIGFFKLESYFRWMANLISPLKNINDLSEDISTSKIKEITIKYLNIEWSLNYGKTDLDGHANSKNADFPHFHIQALVNNRPFIRFNDYHIPFSDADLFNIQLITEAEDLVHFSHSQGEGMSFIEEDENLEEIDKILKLSKDEENAPFIINTLIQMPDGQKMSGEDLSKIFEESEKTNTLKRHLMKKYYPEAKIVTSISPGKGVPEMKKRTKRK